MDPKQLVEALKAFVESGKQAISTRFRSSKLRERNEKMISDILHCRLNVKGVPVNEDVKSFKESMQKHHKVDIFDKEKFPCMKENFNWMKLKSKLAEKFQEADTTSNFVQFLRAGIQAITTAMYETVETTFEDFVTVVPSTLREELYAPNHGVAFPREVGETGLYPEVTAAALDIKLINKKFGVMYPVSMELLKYDTTGSFSRNSALLGEYMKYLKEIMVYGKLLSVAGMKYLDFSIPVSETKPSYETNYPWATSAAPLRGGGYNRPVNFGALSQANIQAGIVALMQQKNLQGIRINVNPSRILCGPTLKFDLFILLHSAFYPSGVNVGTTPGGPMAVNPLQGILDASITRFPPKNDGTFGGDSKFWALVDDSKPWLILQIAEPIGIFVENPQSGQSFERDVNRFKCRLMANADHLDPRFAWLGNDGSV